MYTDPDGHFEGVYNTATGKLVTDPANMGTYNYAPGSSNPVQFIKHTIYDVNPWKKWGNTNKLSFQQINSLENGYGTDEAKENYNKVYIKIMNRKWGNEYRENIEYAY